METKKIRVELEEVKVVEVSIDLGDDLQNYMSKFLALKNHERETAEILEVRNFYGSNHVHVTFLIEDDADEAMEVEHCKDWAEQFGKVINEPEVESAYILDKQANGLSGFCDQLDGKEFYLYN